MVEPFFQVHDLTVRYGSVLAVDSLSLAVGEGSIVGLIGPNGAGKTSFIDGLTGFTAARGRVELDGRDLSRLSAHRRAKAGLVRTWQSIELFEDLTVLENLQVAAESESSFDLLIDLIHPRRRGRSLVDESINAAIRILDIAHRVDALPTELSQGERKLVGVARAVAARPRLVCMDEPAAGLNSEESRRFGRRLKSIAETGISILLVDHDMGMIFDVCDEIYVLDFGRLLTSGTPEHVREDPLVVEAYLGSTAEDESHSSGEGS